MPPAPCAGAPLLPEPARRMFVVYRRNLCCSSSLVVVSAVVRPGLDVHSAALQAAAGHPADHPVAVLLDNAPVARLSPGVDALLVARVRGCGLVRLVLARPLFEALQAPKRHPRHAGDPRLERWLAGDCRVRTAGSVRNPRCPLGGTDRCVARRTGLRLRRGSNARAIYLNPVSPGEIRFARSLPRRGARRLHRPIPAPCAARGRPAARRLPAGRRRRAPVRRGAHTQFWDGLTEPRFCRLSPSGTGSVGVACVMSDAATVTIYPPPDRQPTERRSSGTSDVMARAAPGVSAPRSTTTR